MTTLAIMVVTLTTVAANSIDLVIQLCGMIHNKLGENQHTTTI